MRAEQYVWSDPVELPDATVDALLAQTGRFEVRPAGAGQVRIRPLGYIGAIRVGDVDIAIQPKVPTASVLWLLGRVEELGVFRPEDFDYAEEPLLHEVLAQLFSSAMRRLVRQGLHRRYVEVEESLGFVRGRMLPLQTVRRGRGMQHRAECRFTELTADVAHNRVLRAAIDVLTGLRGLSVPTRARLSGVLVHFEGVGPLQPADTIDRLSFDRLNQHYRPVVRLAAWILRRSTFEPENGLHAAPSFLINMNDLWERHVRLALADEGRHRGLRLASGRGVALDYERWLAAYPDVVLVNASGRPAAAFDAKYKLHSREADVYQALAYAKVLGLPEVTLVYPEDGEVHPRVHTIRNDGTVIRVATLPIGAHGEAYEALDARTRAAAQSLLLTASEGLRAA